MAAPARVVSLNLGTQTVGLAEFQRTPSGGVLLNAYKLTEILADPGAEAARLPQTRLAIGELKDGLKLKGVQPVNYAVSGQNLFARFVKLPTVAEDKVDQIIGFEAQQNVPFPIEEVVWDYQLVGGGKNGAAPGDGQVEVVLVAIKADLLDGLNDAAESAGFRTHVVDAAPMALYNAFRYNYSDLAGCSLLVDLGARTTNLVFLEAGKVFSRSIPIGGNAVTQGLAKEFQEPFNVAETRKKREGMVSLGGTYAEDKNPDIAKAAKLIRNTLTRLHAEISRSINFYRVQQGGAQPQRLFLCGGTANLPYVREFFAEKINAPIEFFNPLRNVSVGRGVNVEAAARHAHQLGELVGLGLRGLLDCPMQLNLRPTGVIRAQRVAARRPYLLAAGLCLLAALAGWWLYFLRAAGIKEEVATALSTKVSTMQGFEKQFQRIKGESDALTARAAPLTQAIEDRQFWPRVLSELNARLPPRYVWITLLEPTSGGRPVAFEDPTKPVAAAGGSPAPAVPGQPARGGGGARPPAIDGLHVKGLYLTNPNADRTVVEFVQNLAKSPLFDLDLSNEKNVILSRSPQTDQAWAFDYDLQLRLKPAFAPPLPRP